MATDYERFLFGEMRTSEATGVYEHAFEILCLGLKMYPIEQMMEYALTASEGLRKAALKHHVPVVFAAVWCLPYEMLQHHPPPKILDSMAEKCYEDSDFAWYYLKTVEKPDKIRTDAAMLRIWYDEGWLKYRVPTRSDLDKLLHLCAPIHSQAKRLALRGPGHSLRHWSRICDQTHFTRLHPRIRQEARELEILMGFENDDTI